MRDSPRIVSEKKRTIELREQCVETISSKRKHHLLERIEGGHHQSEHQGRPEERHSAIDSSVARLRRRRPYRGNDMAVPRSPSVQKDQEPEEADAGPKREASVHVFGEQPQEIHGIDLTAHQDRDRIQADYSEHHGRRPNFPIALQAPLPTPVRGDLGSQRRLMNLLSGGPDGTGLVSCRKPSGMVRIFLMHRRLEPLRAPWRSEWGTGLDASEHAADGPARRGRAAHHAQSFRVLPALTLLPDWIFVSAMLAAVMPGSE